MSSIKAVLETIKFITKKPQYLTILELRNSKAKEPVSDKCLLIMMWHRIGEKKATKKSGSHCFASVSEDRAQAGSDCRCDSPESAAL